MPTVIFRPEGGEEKTIFAQTGENLLDVAKKANIAIDAPCSGNGSCGKCRVKLISGDLKCVRSIHLSGEDYAEGWRLACQSKIKGDAVIGVPDIASAYKSRMKIADLSSEGEQEIFSECQRNIREAGIAFGNGARLIDISLDEPTLDDTMPDNERVTRAISVKTGISHVSLTFRVMEKLPGVLRRSGFHIRCAAYKAQGSITVYDVTPYKVTAPVCGIAIDVGTTSVTAIMMDLENGAIIAKASAGNGQIRFGADVIHRIVEQSRPGGRKLLKDAILEETINPMIHEMCAAADTMPDRIIRAAIAGNSTMNHLLLGIDADPLRMEPYIPAFFSIENMKAVEMGLAVNPAAKVHILPNIGSYVGGDITSGVLASMIWNKDEMSLFIDLGTNGELVLGNRDFLMSCACSAGPAFEGGDISCGMRATDGAIEACRIDVDTLEPTVSVIGGVSAVGFCGSGIIDVIAELFRTGAINAKGQFVRESGRITRDEHGMGEYAVAPREDGTAVTINEADIDNFIRAKGAIFSAIMTMLGSLDMDVSVIDSVYVAGGIGSGINMRNAVEIGMLPDIPIEKFSYIGNSSLAGAYASAMSTEASEKVDEIARSMTYMELSAIPTYMEEFVAACFIPHTDASLFPSVGGHYDK